MANRDATKTWRAAAVLRSLALFVVAGGIAAAFISAASTAALALPSYAARTGLPCAQCHVNPNGGGPRTAFGRAFAAHGHRLPGHYDNSDRDSWHDYGPGMMDGDQGGMMNGYRHGMMGGWDRE